MLPAASLPPTSASQTESLTSLSLASLFSPSLSLPSREADAPTLLSFQHLRIHRQQQNPVERDYETGFGPVQPDVLRFGSLASVAVDPSGNGRPDWESGRPDSDTSRTGFEAGPTGFGAVW